MNMIKTGDHILFQGDSITNAFRMPQEVCNAYQLGAGYAMMVAAQLLASRPHDNLRFTNRGVSGEGIKGLRRRWQADCIDLKPDILSILVGVNDSIISDNRVAMPLPEFESEYRELLIQTRKELPYVKIVLCETFLLKAGDVIDWALNDVSERAKIVRKLAIEFDTVMVELQTVFADALKIAPADYWSFDGIHPNAQGHWLMAEAWLKAVGK
jgi:lysophospholipase L1-like esterase